MVEGFLRFLHRTPFSTALPSRRDERGPFSGGLMVPSPSVGNKEEEGTPSCLEDEHGGGGLDGNELGIVRLFFPSPISLAWPLSSRHRWDRFLFAAVSVSSKEEDNKQEDKERPTSGPLPCGPTLFPPFSASVVSVSAPRSSTSFLYSPIGDDTLCDV